MPERQYRPGDVLDDYCPRERRVTDHAIVAMIDSQIQRTRCVVCDAEHEFKNARVPTPRKKGSTTALFTQVLDNLEAPGRLSAPATATSAAPPAADPPEPVAAAPAPGLPPPATEPSTASDELDDRPFRRSLIRAQLPRPDGQVPPARAIPEFTMHQPANQRPRRGGSGRFRRHPGGTGEFGGPMRSGRPGGHAPGSAAGSGQGGRRRRRKKH